MFSCQAHKFSTIHPLITIKMIFPKQIIDFNVIDVIFAWIYVFCAFLFYFILYISAFILHCCDDALQISFCSRSCVPLMNEFTYKESLLLMPLFCCVSFIPSSQTHATSKHTHSTFFCCVCCQNFLAYNMCRSRARARVVVRFMRDLSTQHTRTHFFFC